MNEKTSSYFLKLIFERVLPIALIVVLVVRMFCYETKIFGYFGLESSSLSKTYMFFTVISIWLQFSAILFSIFRCFFKFKILRNIMFINPLIAVLNVICLKGTMVLFVNNFEPSILLAMLISEICLYSIISIYFIVKDFKMGTNIKEVLFTILMFLLLLIPVMPTYTLQLFFGEGNGFIKSLRVIDITGTHRVFLYITLIVPFVLYFTLRNKSDEVINFTLIFISIATLIGFLVNYNYKTLAEPWNWPIHLCNTAMFIIPLCLIFKMKRLFYFTYYINVLGAALAMLMPSYDEGISMLSKELIRFWYNHWIACFMPLLIVALKRFERPKLKQFTWSMVWFFGYFVIALVLNVVFTGLGKSTDFFFINSDFIADKLGKWAETIFEIKASFNIGSMTLEFRPVYQVLFFSVYILLGLGVWFLYNECFIIADAHYDLHMKLKKIKLEEVARKDLISYHEREKLMDKDLPIVFKLNKFSKKYATSKVYAVKDASLEVYGGEIFGFLGPNGAGKSTIIKSVVGIQPITDGSIEICGFDVKTESVNAKACIGYVPDHYALYEKLTGREYVNYIADIFEIPKEIREERMAYYVSLFELNHSIDSPIKTYSHGMKQKITIIAALIHEPKVWILDEPLTGLDPNSIYQVKECMKRHAEKGNIVFFSSHLIDIVEKLCNRIAIIKKGQIQCVKTLDEIENNGITLEDYYLKVIKGEDN